MQDSVLRLLQERLCGAGCEEGYVKAGGYDEGAAEEHPERWHFMKQEERDDGAGD